MSRRTAPGARRSAAPPVRLSLLDRAGYALIGAVFGTVMGALLVLGLMFALALPRLPTAIIPFSTAYFALVGFFMGGFVGDFIAAGIGGLLDLLGLLANPLYPACTDGRTYRPVWIAVLIVLWLVAAWLIYLRT